MKKNLMVIFSCVGVAALLASPTSAKQVRSQSAAALVIPSDARASMAPFGYFGPYTPSIPTRRYGKNCDFQGGGGDK